MAGSRQSGQSLAVAILALFLFLSAPELSFRLSRYGPLDDPASRLQCRYFGRLTGFA